MSGDTWCRSSWILFFHWLYPSFFWLGTRTQQGEFPLLSFWLCFWFPASLQNMPALHLRCSRCEHEVEKLIGPQANTLSNVLTLCYEMRQAFYCLEFWLEEVPGQVRFTLCPNFFSLHDKEKDDSIPIKYLLCSNGRKISPPVAGTLPPSCQLCHFQSQPRSCGVL